MFTENTTRGEGSPTGSMVPEKQQERCMVEELIEYTKNAEIKHFPTTHRKMFFNQLPKME